MTLALANRKDAIRAHVSTVFAWELGYGSFRVELSRQRKHQPRVIKVGWLAYPFEAQVAEALGDLMADDVMFERHMLWSCGNIHADAMEAWKAHEGNHLLEYPTDWHGHPDYEADKILPEDVEAEVRASGESFESACVPGNYVRCPTCDGGARYMPGLRTITKSRSLSDLRYEDCPDCVRLGTDRQEFPGILDLDNPAHLAFYEEHLATIRRDREAEAARVQSKRDKAMAEPTTTAPANWRRLPTRDAGLVNGIPVAAIAPGCDYLTNAEDPERRVLCDNRAGWFDPTTGLRVCTRHKNGSTR